MKRRIASYAGMIIITLALWVWWQTSGQSDCDSRKLGGCGLFDLGLMGTLEQVGGFLVACLIGTVGWGFLKWGINDPEIKTTELQKSENHD